jgi:hypothetical protein
MVRFFLLSLAVTVSVSFSPLLSASAHAKDRFGIGLIVGDPTGPTGKHHFGGRPAYIDWAVGFPLLDGRGLYGHVDFLWQPTIKTFPRARMDFYFGIGPKLYFWDGDNNNNNGNDNNNNNSSFWLGARAPLGLDFMFSRVPIEVFVEAAAGLWIIRDVDFDLDVAAGARWWF